MNKKLLIIGIALMVLVVFAVPVAAKLPAKSPLPPNNPFNLIWIFFQDLQNQINDLTTKINALTTKVTNLEGQINNIQTVHFGALQDITVIPATKSYIATAATDGFVTVACFGDNEGVMEVWGAIGENPIARSSGAENVYGYSSASITLPVGKGETWWVQWTCNENVLLHWRPLIS